MEFSLQLDWPNYQAYSVYWLVPQDSFKISFFNTEYERQYWFTTFIQGDPIVVCMQY